MVTEHAVKLFMATPEGVLYVKNTRDKLTLPGGGIDPGEDHFDAMARESEEEIGFPISEAFTVPVHVGTHEFVAPDRHDVMHRRLWHVYATATDFRPSEFMIDEGEINGVVGLDRLRILTERDMLDSARAASKIALRSIQSLQRSRGRAGRRTHSELFQLG